MTLKINHYEVANWDTADDPVGLFEMSLTRSIATTMLFLYCVVIITTADVFGPLRYPVIAMIIEMSLFDGTSATHQFTHTPSLTNHHGHIGIVPQQYG